MKLAQKKNLSLNGIIRGINRAVGTFLFVFFFMAQILVFTSDLRGAYWFMPLFVAPSCLVCLTFGADYWTRGDRVRIWSYGISALLSTLIQVPIMAEYVWCYGTSTLVGFFATILLPILVIPYGTWKIVKMRIKSQPTDADQRPTQPEPCARWNAPIRILCMLSICCVVLESWHRVLVRLGRYLISPTHNIDFTICVSIALSILSFILLTRFIRAEIKDNAATFA